MELQKRQSYQSREFTAYAHEKNPGDNLMLLQRIKCQLGPQKDLCIDPNNSKDNETVNSAISSEKTSAGSG